ncbi:hypothetical protein BFN03_09985 [Rhodococcus sp. WMMA185]|uniref:hydantoinase B/oxoprolinase family protein n=1 Tax=Rhodococcus sp. WMMA185 TaxID=679318 RepID=UPI000878CBF3|nr:hydantoinase B/oxoprolinase family protein [Rhodococcus sp. WMMA185]AOW92895.1 hypothetical protein BFN03_09985 [Rhodococcus sp. WMMA185]
MIPTATDPFTLQVIGHALIAISREMGITLSRTSCSPIFNEGNDYSCAIFDTHGQMVTHGEFLPIHLGSMVFATQVVTDAFGTDGLESGDMVVFNDPYLGGTHLPDVTFVAPIFHDGAMLGYAVNRAHQLDIGGTSAGSFYSEARENYQEGLRIAPVKLVRGGVLDEHLLGLIIGNTRLPEQLRVDFEAQMSANRTAIRRLIELAERYGATQVQAAMALILDQSERRTRQAIRRLPDGQYHARDFIDNDGIIDVPRVIDVTVRISGDEAEVDFTGSSEQVEGPLNSVLGCTCAGVYMVFQAATDPDIEPNAGCYRPIKIFAPEGTIVNPRFPAPCTGGTETTIAVHNAMFRALASIPRTEDGPRVVACDQGSGNNKIISGTDPRSGRRYVLYEYPEGGWGAGRDRDGHNAVWSIVGNISNVPVEVVEDQYPVRVERYELRTDSGGPGIHRGGLGIRRDLRVLGHDATVSILGGRARVPPWGFEGGLAGAPAAYTVDPGEAQQRPAAPEFGSKAHNLALRAGEVISQCTAGGGGWGDPAERPPEAVAADVLAGYVSARQAREVYLVVLSEDGEVDPDMTLALRAERSEAVGVDGSVR